MNDEFNCDLKPTEKRLFDCFHLWMKASEQYFAPNEFRISLNSTIQELRNITFILQKHKHSIQNFEEWYSIWQDKMRKDKILKWLVESRNKIVKEGDLETDSIARVSIISNWYKPPINEISVPPFLDPNEIASLVFETLDKDNIPRNAILKIERRWIESNLSDYEILEALVYCFDFYGGILLDAHKNLEVDNSSNCPYVINYQEQIKTIKSDYLLNNDTLLTTYLDLNTLERVTPKRIDFTPTEEDFKEVDEHYEFIKDIKSNKKSNPTLKEAADFNFEFAKNILSKDGYHAPTVILGNKEGPKEILQLKLDSKRDTYLAFRKVAKTVESKRYTNAIFIGETWIAKPDPNKPELLPGDYPDKMEALLVVAINSDKDEYSITALFKRENDKIIFGPKKTVSSATVNFLEPLKEVWENVT